MKFEDIIGKKIAVNCKTEEDVNDFLTECEKREISWDSGMNALNGCTYWDTYYSSTCYELSTGYIRFSSEKGYAKKGYIVISLTDIDEFRQRKMTAMEFLDKYTKMCRYYMTQGNCDELLRKHPEEAIKLVNEWEDPIPYKTIKDDFFEKHPNAPKDDIGYPIVCAERCGYLICKAKEEEGYIANCHICWKTLLNKEE